MNKSALTAALLLGWALGGCSSGSSSISPEERLAVHFGVRGEMHLQLDALEGEFDVQSQYWPRPNAKARLSTGRMVGSWDDQGLCMTSEYDGELIGGDMQVSAAITWDDVRGCYVGLWTRADGHKVMALGDGHMDDGGAIVTVRRLDGTSLRESLQVISPDEHVREVYRTTSEGQEYLSLRLHMARTDR